MFISSSRSSCRHLPRVLTAMVITVAAVAARAVVPADAGSADAVGNLGTIGPTWPIAEHDLLDVMLAKVRHKQDDGEAARLEDELHARADAYIDHPPALHLPRATHDGVRAFDPTQVLPVDIKDAKGNVLWAKGTRINPLEHRSFDETLLFIDGDDPAQVDWLRQRLAADPLPALHDKIVLTGGSPTQLGSQLKQTAYFDQDGRLIAKFAIDAVPASVEADPDAPRERLLIRTFDPLEKHP